MAKRPNLTGKQRAFVDHYLVSFNATEAARQAGYKGDDASLAVTGHNNLRNTKIAAIIDERMSKLSLKANETLARLTMHATADMADFLAEDDYGGYRIDLTKARKLGRLGVIKKLTQTETIREPAEGEFERTVTTKIELHDAQSALGLIGRSHKLFTDKVLHDVTDKAAASAAALIEAMRRGASEQDDRND